MSKKTSIINPHTGKRIETTSLRTPMCAQCLNPMTIDYTWFSSEHTVQVMFICVHKNTTRYKKMGFKLDKKGRLS